MVPHFQLPRLWEEGQVDPFFEGREREPREKKCTMVLKKNGRDLTTRDPVKIAQ